MMLLVPAKLAHSLCETVRATLHFHRAQRLFACLCLDRRHKSRLTQASTQTMNCLVVRNGHSFFLYRLQPPTTTHLPPSSTDYEIVEVQNDKKAREAQLLGSCRPHMYALYVFLFYLLHLIATCTFIPFSYCSVPFPSCCCFLPYFLPSLPRSLPRTRP